MFTEKFIVVIATVNITATVKVFLAFPWQAKGLRFSLVITWESATGSKRNVDNIKVKYAQ